MLRASSLITGFTEARSPKLFFDTFLGTPFGPALSEAFLAQGFDTSVAGRRDCNSRLSYRIIYFLVFSAFGKLQLETPNPPKTFAVLDENIAERIRLPIEFGNFPEIIGHSFQGCGF